MSRLDDPEYRIVFAHAVAHTRALLRSKVIHTTIDLGLDVDEVTVNAIVESLEPRTTPALDELLFPTIYIDGEPVGLVIEAHVRHLDDFKSRYHRDPNQDGRWIPK